MPVALCAAEHPAREGDLYINDAQDHAIRQKLWADWDAEFRAAVSKLIGLNPPETPYETCGDEHGHRVGG